MGFVMDGGVLQGFTPGPGEKNAIIPGNCTEIAAFAFQGQERLERIVLPGTCKKIGEGAFRNCTSLAEVKMENSVKWIGREAFWGCDRLTSLKLSACLERVEENAFGEIPWYVALWQERRKKGKLLRRKNDFIQFGTSFYEYVGFDGAVAIPEGGTYLSEGAFRWSRSSVSAWGGRKTESCAEINSLVIPSWCKCLGKGLFRSMEHLNAVTFLEGCEIIESECFADCISLREVKFPGTLRRIESKAFQNCDKLNYAELPSDCAVAVSAFEERVRVIRE